MFEQLDDPKLAGRKSWKERLVEGAFRKKQLASAAPWITAAPHFAKNLPALFKPAQPQSAQIPQTDTSQKLNRLLF